LHATNGLLFVVVVFMFFLYFSGFKFEETQNKNAKVINLGLVNKNLQVIFLFRDKEGKHTRTHTKNNKRIIFEKCFGGESSDRFSQKRSGWS
jgi:hypothetical protein